MVYHPLQVAYMVMWAWWSWAKKAIGAQHILLHGLHVPKTPKAIHPNVIRILFSLQILAEPLHPLLWLARGPQCAITHFYGPNMWIVGEKQRCVVAMYFLEQYTLQQNTSFIPTPTSLHVFYYYCE